MRFKYDNKNLWQVRVERGHFKSFISTQLTSVLFVLCPSVCPSSKIQHRKFCFLVRDRDRTVCVILLSYVYFFVAGKGRESTMSSPYFQIVPLNWFPLSHQVLFYLHLSPTSVIFYVISYYCSFLCLSVCLVIYPQHDLFHTTKLLRLIFFGLKANKKD